jgi:hypothetical protein
MKVCGFHEGDRSEYLALFAFSTVGHCVPVPRQEDHFFTDLIVHLFSRPQGKTLRLSGLEFGIQIKSDNQDIAIRSEDQKRAFYRSLRPHLIAIVDKRGKELRVYTTIHRLRLAWTDQEKDVDLVFDGETTFDVPYEIGKNRFLLGKPILQLDLGALDHDDAEKRDQARGLLWSVMASWVEFELVAITGRRNFFPGIHLPLGYQTNTVFDACNLYFVPVLGRTSLLSALRSGRFALSAFSEYLESNRIVDKLSSEEVDARADLHAEITRALMLLGQLKN